MKEYTCKHCSKTFIKQQNYASHSVICELNPNRDLIRTRMKEKRKERDLRRNPEIEVQAICACCEESFKYTTKKLSYEIKIKKQYKFFCSISCARSFSTKEKRLEISQKTRNTMKAYAKEGIYFGALKKHENPIINNRIKVYFNRWCEICNSSFLTLNPERNCCPERSCGSKYLWKSGKMDHVDMTKNNNKAYLNGKKVCGGGRTKWYTYKNIRVQGTYELRSCIILDRLKEKGLILDWEYTNDRIQYEDKTLRIRSYLLDFKVKKNNGSEYYLETKGFIQENDLYKWKSARKQSILRIWRLGHILKMEKRLGIINNSYKTYSSVA